MFGKNGLYGWFCRDRGFDLILLDVGCLEGLDTILWSDDVVVIMGLVK